MEILYYDTNDCSKNVKEKITENLEKIWFDAYRNEQYEFSVVSKQLKNPVIKNAYAYSIQNNRVYFSSVVPAEWRKYTYDIYKDVVGVDFKCVVHDCFLYSIEKFNYKNNVNVIELNSILKNTLKLKDIEFKFDKELCLISLKEYFDRFRKYGIHNKKILNFIEEQIKNFNINYFTFCQGNCSIPRLQEYNDKVFFDYIAFYHKPFHYSYLKDFAQIFSRFKDKKFILQFIENNKLNKNIILLFILLENISLKEKEYYFDLLTCGLY